MNDHDHDRIAYHLFLDIRRRQILALISKGDQILASTPDEHKRSKVKAIRARLFHWRDQHRRAGQIDAAEMIEEAVRAFPLPPKGGN